MGGAIKDDLLLGIIKDGTAVGEYTWALQELMKGRGISGEIIGSTYGGWQFNEFHMVPYEVNGEEYLRLLTPDEVVELVSTDFLTTEDLMQDPFFDPFPAGKTHMELLAEAIPARTNPAGSNLVTKFNEQGGSTYNFNMAQLKNGWVTTDTNNSSYRWLHSDIRDVAYLYTYKVYDKFKEIGKLDE